MRMRMPLGLVLMRMVVRPGRHRFVGVQVMPVVMRVGVLVRQRLVVVRVAVRLDQVQNDTRQHQPAARRQHPGA